MRITFDTGIIGLAPGYAVLNAAGTVFQARTTVGVTDLGGGTYSVEVADATLAGRTVLWDTGDDDPAYSSESFPAAATPVDLTDVLALLDAVKLKSDTLGGAGAIEWPYTLTMNGTTPIADVAVWVTSDEAGNNVVASGRTNDFGALVPVPKLDAGTYYFWAKKSGVNFSSPDIEVVV